MPDIPPPTEADRSEVQLTWRCCSMDCMSKKELIERTKSALTAFDKLSPSEQVRQLIEHGAIDANGEVLLGREEPQQEERAEKKVDDK